MAGIGLVIYGLSGLVMLAIGALSVGKPFEDVGGLSTAVVAQRETLVDTLDETANTVAEAGTSFTNLDDSLARAQTSAQHAGDLTRGMSATMRELGRAMQLQVFGTQPLVGLATGFDQAADQLNGLGTDLDAMGSSLGQNATDVRAMQGHLTDLRQQVLHLRDAVQATPSFEGTRNAVATLRVVLYTVIAWLTVLAATCLVLGVAILRA